MKRRTKLERVDEEFARELREIMGVRLQKGLARPKFEELSFREATNLIRRTQSWRGVLEELKFKPKIRK